MSAEQLTTAAMALPLSERVKLAQALWHSIGAAVDDADESLVLREAVRRNEEISACTAAVRTHGDVMQAARRAIGCA